MSNGVPGDRPGRCLGPELSAYADRALCPAELYVWDRHLVACAGCGHAVEQERRMLAALRRASGPDLPGDLRALLLSLGSATPGPPARATGHRVPTEPLRIPPPPVPVVDRSAPALHRSAVRATLFAGLAAGASAAAAWSFAVTGSPLVPPAPSPATPGTAAQRARPAVASFLNASVRARSTPSGSATVPGPGAGAPVVPGETAPVLRAHRPGSAQSSP